MAQTASGRRKSWFFWTLQSLKKLVGERGFEPPAPASRRKRLQRKSAEILAFAQRIQLNERETERVFALFHRSDTGATPESDFRDIERACSR